MPLRVRQAAILRIIVLAGIIRKDIMAGVRLPISIFFTVSADTGTGSNLGGIVIRVCQRNPFRGSDTQDDPVSVAVGKGGYRFDLIAIYLLPGRNCTIGEIFPTIYQLRLQREIDSISHLFQLRLAH